MVIEAIASNPLGPIWKDRLSLSTRVAPEFYEQSDEVGDVPHAGALRTTLDDLRASAVFCVQHVPTVVVLSVDEYDPAAVAPLRAALWNQGLASLLVVVSGDTVRVLSLPRAGVEDDVARFLVEELDAVTDALALRDLVYAAESGRYWEEHPDHFRPEKRVDRVLLDNLTQSHQLLHDAGLSLDAAQALLVQTMFVAYLENREIVGAEYFQGVSNTRAGDFETLLRSGNVESLKRLFEALQQDFNGDLFIAPCSFDAADHGPRFRASHLEVLARFRSGREAMRGPGGQYRFWPYNFRYVPVELVSAVHDRFLAERGPDRRTSGAYYTPMFLADTVISQAWDRLPPAIRDGGRFLDPACGSGIFLVRLFQRLCEHRRAAAGGSAIPWDDLRGILLRLQGRDLDGGAVRMAVFSLYVALLEEVTPPDIRTLMKRGRILPQLYGSTLREEDFFTAGPDDAPADAIVGNPPWSSRRGEGHFLARMVRGRRSAGPGRGAGVAVRLEGAAALAGERRRRVAPAGDGLPAQPCRTCRRGPQAPAARGAGLQRRQLRGPAVPVVRRGGAARRAASVRPPAGRESPLPVRVPDAEGRPQPEIPATDHDRRRRPLPARLPHGGGRSVRLQEAPVAERTGSPVVQLSDAVSTSRRPRGRIRDALTQEGIDAGELGASDRAFSQPTPSGLGAPPAKASTATSSSRHPTCR